MLEPPSSTPMSPTASAPTDAPSRHVPELDGLRGLAILMVLVAHLYLPTNWGAGELPWLKQALSFCSGGVDVFFVLSGYLIGGILLRESTGADRPLASLKTFYLRRAFRILPAYWLLLISYLIVSFLDQRWRFGLIGYLHSDLPFWPYLVFLQNNMMAARQSLGADCLVVTWSLAVEEQFYLFAPFVIGRVSRRTLISICSASLVMYPVLRYLAIMQAGNPFAALYLLICRADAISLGVLIAAVSQSAFAKSWLVAKRYVILGALVTIVLVSVIPWPLSHETLSILFTSIFALSGGAVLLFALGAGSSPLARGLRQPWLTFLGSVSYFTYLFHLPLQYIVQTLARHAGSAYTTSIVAWATIGGLLATLVLARISRDYFEQPLIDRGRKLTLAIRRRQPIASVE
jgi:peptidoglycan/LPS O-acetylase OafA/YrhL